MLGRMLLCAYEIRRLHEAQRYFVLRVVKEMHDGSGCFSHKSVGLCLVFKLGLTTRHHRLYADKKDPADQRWHADTYHPNNKIEVAHLIRSHTDPRLQIPKVQDLSLAGILADPWRSSCLVWFASTTVASITPFRNA